MIRIESVQRSMQSKFVLEKPGDNLDNNHLAKDIVYIINEFAKEKAYLFPERNFEGKSGPKFKNEFQEFIEITCLCNFKITTHL